MGKVRGPGKEWLKRKGQEVSRKAAGNVFGESIVDRAYGLKDEWDFSNYVKGLSGHSREYSIADALDFGLKEIQDYFSRTIRKKTRNVSGKALRKALGSSVSDKIFDLDFYRNVKSFTEDALQGRYKRNITASDYGELRYKGEVVLGLHFGNSIFYTKGEDVRKALGDKIYDTLVKKTGFSEERLNKSFENYVITHEAVESQTMEAYGYKEIGDKEHAKLELYILKSLKNSRNSGAEDIFKVAKEIDTFRTYSASDKWGQSIKEYNNSLPAWDRPLETGYRYAQAS